LRFGQSLMSYSRCKFFWRKIYSGK
jgi:hypothetical protein